MRMPDREFLEDTLGTLSTTGGTDLGAIVPPAPEMLRRVRQRINVDELYDAVLANDRPKVARAITLLESTSAAHRELAQELLVRLLPHSGNALRIGITGVPGVGKSTFIEALGMHLIDQGHRVAVVAIDPSSTKTRGSILGDKTRMSRLSREDKAFIRPSPSAGTLGGVAKATREAMVVFEAAGYDIIIVETVGVGQSEVAVHQMVDIFTFLALSGAGDQLRFLCSDALRFSSGRENHRAGYHCQRQQHRDPFLHFQFLLRFRRLWWSIPWVSVRTAIVFLMTVPS